MAELLESRQRVVVFDALSEHDSPNIFDDLSECLDYLHRHRRGSRFRCSLRSGDEDDLDEVCRAVYEVGDICLAVEEVPWWSTANSQPEGLDLLARQGRHAGVDLVWTAQRLADVSRRLGSATDFWVLFRLTEPRDMTALADRCGGETALKVRDLGLHGRLVYDVINSEIIHV